jgi:hypothetical protein
MPVTDQVCTISGKGQKPAPKARRKPHGASHGGRITFRVEKGTVSVHAAVQPQDESVRHQRVDA